MAGFTMEVSTSLGPRTRPFFVCISFTCSAPGPWQLSQLTPNSPKRKGGWSSPGREHLALDLRWLLKKLGAENVTSLLVEGGGEVNAAFLLQRLAQRIMFFYAPKVLGGSNSRRAVAGVGARQLDEVLNLREVEWRRLGPDLMLGARVEPSLRMSPDRAP